jgi:hypothetical protein
MLKGATTEGIGTDDSDEHPEKQESLKDFNDDNYKHSEK